MSAPASRGRTSRRRFLQLMGGLGLGAGLGLAGPAAAVGRAQAVRYEGRLIDAHCHLYADVGPDVEGLLELFDAAGVEGCWLFGHPWMLASDARGAHPDRIVPFLSETYFTTVHPDSSYVNPEGLEQLLAGGYVRGLGEVILRHSAFQLGADGGWVRYPATSVPADDARLIEAYRLAGQYGAPVTVHQEWFFSAELERALDAAPETTFVWAHAGHGPAGLVAELLDRHANLYADLSARTPWIGPRTVLLRPDGDLDPDWRATLEAFPERFLIGLDLFAPAHYRSEYVARLAEYYRGLLGLLPAEVADLVAHGNAERLAPFEAREAPEPLVAADFPGVRIEP